MDAHVMQLLRWKGSLLRLERDPNHQRPALAHLDGWALSHFGPSTEALRELSHLLRAGQGEPLPRLLSVGASLVRVFVVEPKLPRWSEVHRIGEPAPLLPFDPEVVGLRLGLRRIAKRDELDDATAKQVEAWWHSQGLRTRRVDHCVFGALEETHLDDAEQWQRALATDEVTASRALGQALGYPSCCVDAYVALGSNDDVALACQLLPWDMPPASPLTLWLHAPLALISHAPCSLQCEPTQDLARQLLAGLEDRYPGFAKRWVDAAKRVHAFDAEGVAWSIGADALILDGNALVATPRASWSIDVEGFRVGEQRFGLHADHRGEL